MSYPKAEDMFYPSAETSNYEDRVKTCEMCRGLHFQDPFVVAAFSRVDWVDYYPEVDSEGLVTGEVIDGYENGYANVDDEALVRIDDLPAYVQHRIKHDNLDGTWDGYVTLPPFIPKKDSEERYALVS